MFSCHCVGRPCVVCFAYRALRESALCLSVRDTCLSVHRVEQLFPGGLCERGGRITPHPGQSSQDPVSGLPAAGCCSGGCAETPTLTGLQPQQAQTVLHAGTRQTGQEQENVSDGAGDRPGRGGWEGAGTERLKGFLAIMSM